MLQLGSPFLFKLRLVRHIVEAAGRDYGEDNAEERMI
jgi:hypothetical protein